MLRGWPADTERMRRSHIIIPTLLAAAAAAGALVALPANGALTSGVTGPAASSAGSTAVEGSVSGFTVSEIAYALDRADAARLAGVTFTVSPAPASGGVRVRLAPGGPWFACSAAGSSVRCTTSGVALSDVGQLSVVATG